MYYDQSGKAQPVADVGLVMSYSDTGLTDGQQYCYMVTSKKAECESAMSDPPLCATPQPSSTATIGAAELVTGQLVTSGKGKNAETTWTLGSSFSQGDTVTLRVRLIDGDGVPVEGGSATIRIGGPETATVNTGGSDADGFAYAEWKTSAPRKGRGGTAAGSYTASVTDVTASGYNWDSVATSATFTIQ